FSLPLTLSLPLTFLFLLTFSFAFDLFFALDLSFITSPPPQPILLFRGSILSVIQTTLSHKVRCERVV
ncbi:hypothetical protein, partial [Bacillus thuringiensis]|uniref:hypothetical protein n=1 Tax=Bacillus thuringiensis TaxID=1428 RepID=UPI001C3DB6A0